MLSNNQKIIKPINENLTKECELNIEISDPIPLAKFDLQKDDRDLSYYAYSHFNVYMRNILKVNRYWITKNKIFGPN